MNPELPSIDVVIGTKAQYIKTAPLLRLLQRQGVAFRLIDTGQHAALTPGLREALGIGAPDVQLGRAGNVKSIAEALSWAAAIVWMIIARPGYLKTRVFSVGPGYCVIHGDTPSTLLALLMAKRAGKTVVHLEAGLRSFDLLRPFPEEIIRILCMRSSDLLFAPSAWAMNNLRLLRVRGRCVQLSQNTNVEAMYHALGAADRSLIPGSPYCMITLHRVETIFSRKRLHFMLEVARRVARDRTVLFVLHDPTEKKLRDFRMLDDLAAIPGVRTLPLLPHAQFLALLEHAEFVITDGGSIQEESFYLDVPCLVMRTETERTEGVGGNVRLGHFNWPEVDSFLSDFRSLRRGAHVQNEHPSAAIVGAMADFAARPQDSARSDCGSQE